MATNLTIDGPRTVHRTALLLLPLAIGVALLVVMFWNAPTFFRLNNLINILVQTSALGVMAVGMSFVMIGGGMDLSIPANMAFSAVLGAYAMRWGGVPLGLATMLSTSLVIGLFNGTAVAAFGMTPFVVTLATMTVVGGATVWMTNSQSLSDFPDAFFDLVLARPLGIPLAVILLVVVAAAATVIVSSTRLGRSLYAVGLNQKAARVARVHVGRVLLSTYVVSGLLAGLAAIMLTARLGSASANLGSDGVVLDIVSSCVVGGISIYGGAGKPVGAVLGALFIILISNSLNQLGVSFFINLVIKGIAIIAFIYLDRLTSGGVAMSGHAKLVMTGIGKRFAGVMALDDASLSVVAGEAHALVGANGAGKSTMMNVLGGVIRKDQGQILIDGAPIEFHDPREARRHGIGVVHQELNMLLPMTVAENVLIDELPTRAGLTDLMAMREKVRTLLDRLGCQFDVDDVVETLSIGDRQMVEVARALSCDPGILIFDEPTSSLSNREKERLFQVIAVLKRSGVAIVYITHFLHEITEVCERVTVMRNGRTVATSVLAETTLGEVVQQMLGDVQLQDRLRPPRRPEGTPLLEARDLTRQGVLHHVSLDLFPGEIVGLWGLLGSGRTEILRALVGLDPLDGGSLRFARAGALEEITPSRLHAQAGFVTEDRRGEGLLLPLPVVSNVSFANLAALTGPAGLIDRARERSFAQRLVDRLRIKISSLAQPVRTLSGGNQQKVVFARWLGTDARIYLLDEPTRGLDVNAKSEILRLTTELAGAGAGVLIVCSDLEELMRVCDRYLVVHRGRIVGELPGGADKEALMRSVSEGSVAA